MMASLVQTTTPLPADGVFNSGSQSLARALSITGSVYADEPGTLVIEQGGDGTHWDITNTFNVPPLTGVAIDVPVVDQFFQVVYTNGNAPQGTFRLFVDIRDPYGAFLAIPDAPSEGGAWFVLIEQGGTYSTVGRFDASDGLAANQSAAVFMNKSAQYASVPVVDFTVSVETLTTTTEHTVASF